MTTLLKDMRLSHTRSATNALEQFVVVPRREHFIFCTACKKQADLQLIYWFMKECTDIFCMGNYGFCIRINHAFPIIAMH